MLWSPSNSWKEAWNRSANLWGLVPIAVPHGDLQDVKDIGDEQSLAPNPSALRTMLGRYNAGEAVMAMAIADEDLARITAGHQPAVGTLTINIYRTDRARPEYVDQITHVAQSGQTRDQLFDSAVLRVHQALQKDWKSRTMVSAEQSNKLQVRIPIGSLEEWTRTRRSLSRVQGVSEIAVRSLTSSAAQVDITFQGTEQRLRLALDQAGITLSLPRFSNVGLSNNPFSRRGSTMVYELYLKQYAPAPPATTMPY